ncbi:MAG TPA: LuxR C-terminal-related transcriptional regulator [Arachnia sp.]|nr:LuxR C-terminal-related transcriptional regulator [Arachnia sp.]HMT86884.1 LuxR C-terminal-related transcriptional regulator [Arachnia sp.]
MDSTEQTGRGRPGPTRDGAPLTVVIAPAGFGKSTLIDQWRRRSQPSAAGSFDAFYRTNSVDAGILIAECAGALGVSEDEQKDAIGLIHPDGESLGPEFVRRMAESLRTLPGPFTLFLDDLHGMPEETAKDVGRLVSLVADDRHRFVVASRTTPPWPVERWRVSGFAEVVTADQLRLTVEDIAGLLDPEFAHLAPRVREVTEGWPAAVEVVRWRLRGGSAVDFEAAVLDLIDYVADEVLPVLPEPELRVLTRTSILPPFPVSVAVAVSGEITAAAVLDDVHRRTSLITRFDDGTHQYHAVLRAALRRWLTHAEPALEEELQVRAADAWLEEPDSLAALSHAIDHLVEGRAWERAVELLRRSEARIERGSRLDRFVQWLEAVPGSWWRDDSELLLLYAAANLRIGRTGRAIEVLRGPALAGDPGTAAIANLTYAWMTGWSTDPREALRLCAQARPAIERLDGAAGSHGYPRLGSVSRHALAADIATAQSHVFLGEFETAIEELTVLRGHRAEIGAMPQSALCGSLAFALALRGETSAATARASEALQLAYDAGAVEGHVRTVPALLAQAVVAQATGDNASALAQLENAAARCRPSRAANLLAMCGLVASMCGETRSYLADLEPPAAPAPLPLVDQFTAAAEARALTRLGDHLAAERQLQATEPNEFTLGAWVEVLLPRLERRRAARWLATQGSPTCPRGQIVRLLANAAVVESDARALQLAQAAADLAAPERLLGVLMDAPEQLLARLDGAQPTHPLLIEALSRLGTTDLPSFTARELEILRLLPHISTAEELASRLFVSANTAKWHRANIYRKLGVHRREDAVARAVQLGLIKPGG